VRRSPFLRSGRAWSVALALACLPAVHAALAQAPEGVHGLGRVRGDGSLLVDDTVVHLAGVSLPRRPDCRAAVGAAGAGCTPGAVRALADRVSGFVHCAVIGRRRDGSVEGFCSIAARSVLDPRTDLGAWLIDRGLALAGTGAPPEYFALERLAEVQGQGLWARPSADPRKPYR
jgi:endonuclease YncB( thermonuclease family)